jgi:hypothetical protein
MISSNMLKAESANRQPRSWRQSVPFAPRNLLPARQTRFLAIDRLSTGRSAYACTPIRSSRIHVNHPHR